MINYWLYETFLMLIGLCGILVIVSKSPINSVLFLCGLYLAGGGIFLLLDHYFLGLTLIIVYVGAIAILFLFTIFMINVRLTLQLGSFASPLVAVLLIIGFGLYFIFADSNSPFLVSTLPEVHSIYASDWSHLLSRPSDLTMLGNMIFHAYPLALILIGFLLLIVMVAIIRVTVDTP